MNKRRAKANGEHKACKTKHKRENGGNNSIYTNYIKFKKER